MKGIKIFDNLRNKLGRVKWNIKTREYDACWRYLSVLSLRFLLDQHNYIVDLGCGPRCLMTILAETLSGLIAK